MLANPLQGQSGVFVATTRSLGTCYENMQGYHVRRFPMVPLEERPHARLVVSSDLRNHVSMWVLPPSLMCSLHPSTSRYPLCSSISYHLAVREHDTRAALASRLETQTTGLRQFTRSLSLNLNTLRGMNGWWCSGSLRLTVNGTFSWPSAQNYKPIRRHTAYPYPNKSWIFSRSVAVPSTQY